MRSRPDLLPRLRQAVARAGEPLEVDILLRSAAETPIDFIEAVLRGHEIVQYGRYGEGREILNLVARDVPGEGKLGAGDYVFRARFDVPKRAIPTYRGHIAKVHYVLGVHVSIPWWPDRRGSYGIPVVGALPVFVATPKSLASTSDGPRGSKPYIEASLESTTLVAGERIDGMVSVQNPGQATIRGVDLCLVRTERLSNANLAQQVMSHRWRIHDGAPRDGEPFSFAVRLPRDLPPPVEGSLFRVGYTLEIVVDVAWGFDAKIVTPVLILPVEVPHPHGRAVGAPTSSIAPVGRERMRLVWTSVAEARGLAIDGDRMHAEYGPVSLSILLEQRGTDGYFSTARLAWPPLGIDLHVEPRTWTDALTGGALSIDVPGADRFTTRAREAAQAHAILGTGAFAWLASFLEAHVYDHGALLASRGGAHEVVELDAFVVKAVVAARAIAKGISELPPPASMASTLPAWEAFAARLQGKLDRGPMAVRGVAFAGESAEIETRWGRDGAPIGTAVKVVLAPPLALPTTEPDPDVVTVDLASPGVSADARARAAAILAIEGVRHLHVAQDRLEALVDAPLADPAVTESVLQALADLARSLRGMTSAGPFR
jgi:hypothetical protein